MNFIKIINLGELRHLSEAHLVSIVTGIYNENFMFVCFVRMVVDFVFEFVDAIYMFQYTTSFG